MCSMGSNCSVQEVPFLQYFRNSSCNQKTLCNENNIEYHTEDSKHESVGNRSNLPFLETSTVINQDLKGIQNNINLFDDKYNNDDICSQIIRDKYEELVRNEPGSSNQFHDSTGNPVLIKNFDLVHFKSEDLGPVGEGIETYGVSSTDCNVNSSCDCSNNDCNVNVECIISHDSPDVQQDGLKFESFGSFNSVTLEGQLKQSNLESTSSQESLNQSNIENIPPKELNDSCVKNIAPFRKTNARVRGLDGANVLQELPIEILDDSMISTCGLKIDHIYKVGYDYARESSDEMSFISLNNEEDSSISTSNSQCSSMIQSLPETNNKEKGEPPLSVQSNQNCIKSKIPISSHVTILKPASFHHAPFTVNEKWLSDLKRKKIPKPKKPDYMVSPAKLGSILKNRNQPMSIDKPALADVETIIQSKIKSSTTKPIPGSSMTLVTPRKQFKYIKSPISEYIRTGKRISTAKTLPVLRSSDKTHVPITGKQILVQKLPSKIHSSAEKLIMKPCSSSSVLKPAENNVCIPKKS
ncbi:uncharacterized protein [Halyomorpha halys]|nr:uncharacterized protein LOC106689770 isoform X2 [Halyomorpha halys]